MRKRGRGFTIVELLIVIVVIAILASITTMAYAGVRQRAANASSTTTIGSYVKALGLYKADKGVYPEDGTTTDVYRCLGENYPSGCGSIGATTGCGLGTISNSASATFNNALRPYMNNVGVIPRVNEDGLMCGGALVAGAMYVYRGSSTLLSEIYYVLAGPDSNCVVPGGARLAGQVSNPPNTLCRLYLN